MAWRILKAVVLLPGTALVVIPGLVLWSTSGTWLGGSLATVAQPVFWIGVMLAVPGLGLAVWTVALFVREGRGTPAPWDPPRHLVIQGPYRHVRNPMITSVLVMLAAEALLFQSPVIAAWAITFFAVNALYFPLHEETRLEERFGDAYRNYARHVPRWVPRLDPWSPASRDD